MEVILIFIPSNGHNIGIQCHKNPQFQFSDCANPRGRVRLNLEFQIWAEKCFPGILISV